MDALVTDAANSRTFQRARFSFVVLAVGFAFCLGLTVFLGRYPRYYPSTLSVFFSSLIALCVACQTTRLGNSVAQIGERFASFLSRRGAFRSDAVIEAPKFALIRVAFGAFMVERATWILIYMTPQDWENSHLVAVAIINLAAAIFVCIGLMTQFALAYLIVIQWQVSDVIMGTSTLGNDVGAMLSVLLIFANAGAHWSVDSWLLRRKGTAFKFLHRFYFRDGYPSDDTLQITKFLVLLSYWCVCLYSLAIHLNEPAWMDDGRAIPAL